MKFEEISGVVEEGINSLRAIEEHLATIENQLGKLNTNEEVINAEMQDASNLLAAPLADEEVLTAEEVSPVYEVQGMADQLSFSWMSFVLMIVIAVALMLNLGVNIWLAFTDKWRS